MRYLATLIFAAFLLAGCDTATAPSQSVERVSITSSTLFQMDTRRAVSVNDVAQILPLDDPSHKRGRLSASIRVSPDSVTIVQVFTSPGTGSISVDDKQFTVQDSTAFVLRGDDAAEVIRR